ncbi:hypothetical protein [Nostoc sp. XA010]|nr:hypothetical protein [Nostoc sp. XA010]
MIYATVLEGAIRSKINENPEQVYHQGERTAFLKPLLDKDLDEKIG